MQNRHTCFVNLRTIWEYTYGCVEKYICATELSLVSILAHSYHIIIYHAVGAPGHGRDFVDGLNSTYKRFLYVLITTVELPGALAYNSYMTIHTLSVNKDNIPWTELKKTF